MRRGLKLLLTLLVVLIGLVIVNAIALDSETKPAEVTAEGGEILDPEGSPAALQVFDPEGDPAARGDFGAPAASGAARSAGGPSGRDRPIVLLHCFGCSSQWWNPILAKLEDGHRVIRVDLIGHGGSEKPKAGYEIETQAAAVANVLNSLGVTDATIVGHSMGGFVATALAETASELVGRVVLVGTPARAGESELPFTERLTRVPGIGQALWRLRPDATIRSGYESAFAPGTDVSTIFPGDPDRVVDDNRAMTYRSFTKVGEANRDFMTAEGVDSRLAATGVPLLFVDGDEDQIFDAATAAEQFQTVPGARTELIEGVGHSPNVEAPEETARLILNFADAGSGGSSPPRVSPEGRN